MLCRLAIGPSWRLFHHLRQTGRLLPGPAQEIAEHIDGIALRGPGSPRTVGGVERGRRGAGTGGGGWIEPPGERPRRARALLGDSVQDCGPRFPGTRHLLSECPSHLPPIAAVHCGLLYPIAHLWAETKVFSTGIWTSTKCWSSLESVWET